MFKLLGWLIVAALVFWVAVAAVAVLLLYSLAWLIVMAFGKKIASPIELWEKWRGEETGQNTHPQPPSPRAVTPPAPMRQSQPITPPRAPQMPLAPAQATPVPAPATYEPPLAPWTPDQPQDAPRSSTQPAVRWPDAEHSSVDVDVARKRAAEAMKEAALAQSQGDAAAEVAAKARARAETANLGRAITREMMGRPRRSTGMRRPPGDG